MLSFRSLSAASLLFIFSWKKDRFRVFSDSSAEAGGAYNTGRLVGSNKSLDSAVALNTTI